MTRNVYTVGQVNAYIKNMFTQDYMLNRIYVKGEVSNCKYHTSGHIYFSLKDETGVLSCVMFAGHRRGLAFRMKDGDRVVVGGAVDVYERDGRYQLYAREIMPDGEGDLYRQFELLKKDLEEMGMFAQEYKRPIPKYVKRVGVVTAPTGAAVQDIRNIAARRNPYVQLILYPALVQGDGAIQSIINGIHALDELGVDVMIVGRGGGSIEDLWAFNEEAVARAIFACETPIISAVGHETDTTIADFVADLRAPTPSAAAELAIYDYQAVEVQRKQYYNRMCRKMEQKLTWYYNQLEQLRVRLRYVSPEHKLCDEQRYAAELEEKLLTQMNRLLEQKKHEFAILAGRLDGLSPAKKLSQGYAYVSDMDGKALKDVKNVKVDDTIKIHLLEGSLDAKVTKVTE